MTIYKENKKGKSTGAVHLMADKNFDPDLERLGNFFVRRMAGKGCTFEAFVERPEWAWSVYGMSGKSFDKALIAG